ncbi:hypothetical protein [Corynebacterium sp. 805_CJEI]|uniref:hypothetical protein n=1 Tax=Corynebacterium sp. 805_CJEI TaxID=2715677 RepID=UPI0006679E1C|nr:hypothetical protein [Corynebacterium sp. 805_CJEI]
MTTVFVDLVNLDGSRPEGSLRFSLERLVLGAPDVVPSAVEVKIRDGKARVENLLPGAMRVRVNAGCWSKDWQVTIPAEGEHDLLDLLEWQADEFQETVWAELAKRVEALENTPAVDLAPVEKRLDALEGAPVVDLAPLEETARDLSGRVEKAEKHIESVSGSLVSTQFSLFQREIPKLKAQLAELQAHLTPVEVYTDGIGEDLAHVYETGAVVTVVQHAGRVNIDINSNVSPETLIRALDMLKLPHFPKVSTFPHGGRALCSVELFQGVKFLTKIEPTYIQLEKVEGIPTFHVALDDVLAVVQETGANRMSLSTFYYTTDLPPVID